MVTSEENDVQSDDGTAEKTNESVETPVAADGETPKSEAAESEAAESKTTASETPESESPKSSGKQRVLFLCTGNSCRSHMGEGLLRHLADDRFESLSAGSKPAGYVHPLAVRVMEEIGVDISEQQSKSIDLFVPPDGKAPDLVISVCGRAENDCPTFPANVGRLHLPFDDPAQTDGSEEEKLAVFRRVRDEMKETLEGALGISES